MIMSDALGEDGEFGLSALRCCTGFATSDDGERVAPAIGFQRKRKRIEKIDAVARSENRGEIEGRKKTDDGGGLIVERERFTDGFATNAGEFVITDTVECEKSGHVAERFILFA